MSVGTARVGRMTDGTPVYAHTLKAAAAGPQLRVSELGASVNSLVTRDRHGAAQELVLAHATLGARLASTAYLGSTVGRYANRIAAGSFRLDHREHVVATNEGRNALHGGRDGFDRRLWQTVSTTDCAVRLAMVSPDGDQGFPGALTVQVTFEVRDDSVSILYEARTTAPTVVNLTNHSYFNLDGHLSNGIDDHLLTVHADTYTPVDAQLIPLGHVQSVAGTPFDLNAGTRIGDVTRNPHPQLLLTHGLDHHFDVRGDGLRRHATLFSPRSGLTLTVSSDQPGLQVYSGNFLDGSVTGPHGRTYRQGAGIALETQHAPNSPNRPQLPSTVLRPGEIFRSITIWDLGLQLAG
ncbi:MAG TPA: aldose epimerase family protein [Lapillicoccus sp.]|uniref:aldose epimerase family protein n=1 Tax=Lapillicoccus sp. TaxID=1909287 RepID=UPI002F9378E5